MSGGSQALRALSCVGILIREVQAWGAVWSGQCWWGAWCQWVLLWALQHPTSRAGTARASPNAGPRAPASCPSGATVPGGTQARSQPHPTRRMHRLLFLLIQSILSSPGHVLSRDPDTGNFRVPGRMHPGGIWSLPGGSPELGALTNALPGCSLQGKTSVALRLLRFTLCICREARGRFGVNEPASCSSLKFGSRKPT